MIKKLSLISILLLSSFSSFSQTYFELNNKKQIGLSDGFTSNGTFTGTKIYFSSIDVFHNGKKTSLSGGFTIIEANKNESLDNPEKIFIGNINSSEKDSSKIELKKLEAIGLEQKKFELLLKNKFKNVVFI